MLLTNAGFTSIEDIVGDNMEYCSPFLLWLNTVPKEMMIARECLMACRWPNPTLKDAPPQD